MRTNSAVIEGMPGDEMNLPPPQPTEPQKTGRILVLFERGQSDQGKEVLRRLNIELSTPGDNIQANRIYPKLEVAVITPKGDQRISIKSLEEEAGSPILVTAEERVIQLNPKAGAQELKTPTFTWGLDATKVTESTFSGRGIKVAVLDTGFDLNHPDFEGRTIKHRSFVAEEVQDEHGHGTHCTGTACGPKTSQGSRRYGVAYEADIYIGKVLGNDGDGVDESILAGINWAIDQNCHIVSMSLGGFVLHGEEYSVIYEAIAKRALEQNTLIVAAAGNDSRRDEEIINPVSSPANCPSILAVGAIDQNYQIARFSNGTKVFKGAGNVDLVGPGVDVYSSWSTSRYRKYYTISGTSMATPHVAGIAALYAEAEGLKGRDLWKRLIETAKSLDQLDQSDVGSGLIQAP